MKATIENNTLRYDCGVECSFTTEEITRLQKVASTPRSPYEKQSRQLLPKELKDFSNAQKELFADVLGDTKAIEVFGNGPWTREARKAVAKARVERRKAKQ